MTPDEIAKRLDNRAGYELVTYGEVGLPVFGIYATALSPGTSRTELY